MTIEDLTPDNIEIMLPLNGSQNVQFTTNISVYNPSHVELGVQLTATNGEDWDTNVTPDQMTFNETGTQEAVITVTVPGNINITTEFQVKLDAQGWYPNMTMSLDASSIGYIYIEQHHALEVTYRFTKMDQYSNRIEFSVTNKGNANEYISPEYMSSGNPYMADNNLDVSFDFNNGGVSPNGPPLTIIMIARYSGSTFPKTYTLEVRFHSRTSMSNYFVSTNVTVSFYKPDTTQQNYLFFGAIGAFVVIMVVVMVLVLRGPSKGKR